MKTKELIDRIFKEPGIQYSLSEFENLGKPIAEIVSVYPRTATTGRDAGKTKYLKSFSYYPGKRSPLRLRIDRRSDRVGLGGGSG